MSKLDALKDKLNGVKATLAEKADKIAFIKSWREKAAASAGSPAAAKPRNPYSLSSIYKEGSTFTRLQVLMVLVLSLTALASTGILVKKIAGKLKSTSEHEQIKQDYSNELSEMKRKHLEKAEMLALGQFTTNAYAGEGEVKMMTIDLWIRVSDPSTAAVVDGNSTVFHDKAMGALSALYVNKVNLLTEEGKNRAKNEIKAALGEALPAGHSVEEVFIQNLMLQ